MTPKYKVIPELKNLFPPQTESERATCLEAIRKAGKSEPGKYFVDRLTGWKVLIDGHNRLEICELLGIEFAAEVVPGISSQTEAIQWMISYQTGRRNRTRVQLLAYMALNGGSIGELGATVQETADLQFLLDYGQKHLERLEQGQFTTLAGAKLAVSREQAKQAALELRAKEGGPIPTTSPVRPLKSAVRVAPTVVADKPLPPIGQLLGSDKREAWAIALLSDVHAGARFVENDDLFGNAYNPDICRMRLQRWFEGVHWMLSSFGKALFDVPGLCVWFGGDLIDGHLHEDQKETSDSPIATVNWLKPFLTKQLDWLIERLADNNRRLRLVCSYGNHGRDTEKPVADLQAEHSHEWLMYQDLARYLVRYDNVEVLANKAAHQYTEIYGRKLHFTHGDSGGKFGGGVGGLSIPVKKNVAKWDRRKHAEMHHLGHFHQQLDGGNWMVNGSVIGYSPYAAKANCEPEAPQQLFYLQDSKRGKTAVSPIWVCDREEERKAGLG